MPDGAHPWSPNVYGLGLPEFEARNGRGGKRSTPLLDRFWSRIEYDTNGGCWLWSGSTIRGGYGQIHTGSAGRAGSMAHVVHRLSYEIHKGPIPEGLVVRHACDVPCCVNPDHLLVGTAQDNKNDSVVRGRHAFGERAPSAKLNPDLVRWVRSAAAGGRTYRWIAGALAESGISIGLSSIHQVVTRHSWNSVP